MRIGPVNREDLQRVALLVLAQHPQRRVPAWLGCLSSRLRFLTGALLVGANLGGTVLEWTYAAEADLTGASLGGANFSGTDLSDARLDTGSAEPASRLTVPQAKKHTEEPSGA